MIRRTQAALALWCVAAVLLEPGAGHAENPAWPPAPGANPADPATWPDDPGYAGQWNLWSWVPAATLDTLRPEEASMGTGFHADRAWELSVGRDDVLIAVLDSGALWGNTDLVNKWYLNDGELPPPDAGCVGGGTGVHDANGDGLFNVQDYTTALGHEQPLAATACDTRVSDANGNGLIDPEDLILALSDGVDDDANGYVDDIAGWDFLWNDNDARDDTEFGHGTGEARDSCAETNNGIGDAGTCPLCRVMPVRSGDSFVVDVNDFAQATVFAVDSGAAVVQEALGAINNTALAMEALEYAWDSGVVVVASAADEMSRHHNFPGSNNHTIYVHAIRMDDQNDDFNNSTTFLNFNNCTNYGGNLALSTPGTGCSSEATGKTSGVAGLVVSYARARGVSPALSPAEVRALLVATATDIDVPEGLAPPCDTGADCGGGQRCMVLYDGNACLDLCAAGGSCADEDNFTCRNPGDGVYTCLPLKFPSQPGWDQFFGYGRTDARAALDALAADEVPPAVDVTSPLWFDYVRGDVGSVAIVGSITTRYPTYDYTVEWARGIQPADVGDFVEVENVAGLSGPTTGTLGTIDVADIVAAGPPIDVPPAEPNSFTITVRVRATAHGAGAAGTADVTGEFRKVFAVHSDPDLLPGYPLWMGASGESSPKLADLDGDGAKEIVLATSDGLVHAIANAGGAPAELPGFPAELFPLAGLDPADPANHLDATAYASGAVDVSVGRHTVTSTPAVGDLDGDGDLEIVVASHDGALYVIDAGGAIVPPFPVSPDPALSTLTDRDHELDFGFAIGSPALGDLDGDGTLEIVAPALDGYVYVWHADGTLDSGFPVELVDPTAPVPVHRRLVSSPALGDLDRDGRLDIVIGSSEGYAGDTQGRVYVLHGDGDAHPGGAFHPGWPIPLYSATVDVLPFVGQGVPNAPALADVDGDGTLEVAIETIGDTGTLYYADQSMRPGLFPLKYAIMENYDHGPSSDSIDRPLLTLIDNGSFGDLDQDGQVDFVKGGAGFGFALAFASGGKRAIFEHMLGAWNLADTVSNGGLLTAAPFPAWPRRVEDWMFFMNPAIADVSGDGLPEVINGTGGYELDAFDAEGAEPPGWPKFMGGWIIASPAVGDVDGDGDRDVVSSTRNGYLFAWTTTAPARGALEWESFHHDLANTGNYEVPLADDLPPPDAGADAGADGGMIADRSGCGCRVVGAGAGTGAAGTGAGTGTGTAGAGAGAAGAARPGGAAASPASPAPAGLLLGAARATARPLTRRRRRLDPGAGRGAAACAPPGSGRSSTARP